jgi:regulator of replication initiation timing
MDEDLFAILENRVEQLLKNQQQLIRENGKLVEENRRLLADRAEVKARLDALIVKLEGMVE